MTHSFPTQRSSDLSWKVGVDFKPVAGSLFYANVTKGYKAGSFPTIGAATVSQYRPVVQESVITYEAGFKQELFDRSVLLTGAGFYYDYRNKQLRGFFDQPPFGTVFALDNVPKSTVKGGELARSEEHTSELQSLMRTSYAVFCLKKKKKRQRKHHK